ncbi:MAG: hypothetical protein HY516_01970 [Candidatus Aenigmarchaeota archaeon]|nr:hypothetical protein [Candidatus Aenigmarchaeota archaeon]
MSWLKSIIESGGTWYNFKQINNESGTITNVIFGYSGIGSPHGHDVFVNQDTIYARPFIDLACRLSGTQVIIHRALKP